MDRADQGNGAVSDGEVHPEIVIVRRGHGDHDDGHHGGVWKIAYADFMTAMMAFFLVMWLINAANEATRAQVASYFNPVKLTDSVTSDKGLTKPKNKSKKEKKDSEEQPKPEEEEKKESQDKAEEEKEGESEKKKAMEDRLFKDPYVVLAELAGEAQQGSPAGDAKVGAATEEGGNAGLRDGEAYRDPFDPQAWRDLPVPQPEGEPGGKPETAKTDEAKAEPKPEEKMPKAAAEKAEVPPEAKKPEEMKPEEMKPEAKNPEEMKLEEKKSEEKQQEAAAALAEKIKDAVGGVGASDAPKLSVEVTDEGVLISLTDTVEFGMFTVGSAQPRPEVIAIMEKIAGLIKAEPGQVVLRGHTDARPYKSDRYDNWRLSSARAQMAYYMLTRAGLDPGRVVQIEGHADRMLKRGDEPFAAENRRIEILLRKSGAEKR